MKIASHTHTHTYIYTYIYRKSVSRFSRGTKPLKSEAIHETGLSGYVVASFFPLIIFIYIYIYIYKR